MAHLIGVIRLMAIVDSLSTATAVLVATGVNSPPGLS